MSKTVDERVVEMRFDNKQFESNVQTSMSTLDKLKKSLRLDKSAKSFETINSEAKKVNFTGLGNAVESVQAKFSALQVIGVTALANITNSAVNAGKKIASALTIEPITSGFEEYQTQMGAIQTILANTQKEGTNVEKVNAALDELNLYADQTIYNFTEMARNIGTFTAAGVKLDDSVSAIKGIANLAAVSGSTSQQASTAMYQLSQALAAGKVSLMDWNSVVNAGMGGQVFQDALIRTSEHLKTGAKEAIETYGSFRESLTKGEWLTTEVLTETLSQISGAYTEAELIAQGYSEEQAKAITQLAETAVAAATEVKTFSQLWDTLKEAAQSGWGQTWRTIVGDFDKAKERMTKLSEVFGGIINDSANARNAMFSGALDSNLDKLTAKLNDAGVKTEEFQNRIKELAKNHNVDLDSMIEKEGSFEKALIKAFTTGKLDKSILKDAIKSFTGSIDELTGSTEASSNAMEKYGEIVSKVIKGDFGNGEERVKALTEAGYDYATIQNLVNEQLGSSVRHLETLSDEQIKNADSLEKLSDEQLKSQGYTEDQITALRDLAKAADESGSSIDELINNIEKPSGSELLWDSIFNIIDSITESLGAVKKAWTEAFHPGMSEDEIIAQRAETLYNILDAVHNFTVGIQDYLHEGEGLDKITRSFQGLFAIVDIFTTIIGGGFKLALKAVSKVLGAFDTDILGVTANVGDALVKFRDWLFENNILAKALDSLIEKLPVIVDKFKEWYEAFKASPVAYKFIEAIEGIQSAFSKLFNGDMDVSEFASKIGRNLGQALKELPKIAIQIGKDFIAGFQNGVDFEVPDIIDKIITFCLNFVSAFAEALGVHSPSWKAFEIVSDFFQGAINGIKAVGDKVLDALGIVGDQIVKFFKGIWDFLTDESGNIEWDKIVAGGIIFSTLWVLKQFATAINGVANALGGFDDLISGASGVMKKFEKVLGSVAWDIKAKAIQKMAIAIAILAASVWVLAQIDDPARLWNAVGIIVVLAGVLVGLAVALDKMSDASVKIGKEGLNIDGLKTGLIQIGLAILALAATAKILGSMNPEEMKQGFLALAGLAVGMLVFMAALGGISIYAKDVGGLSSTFAKMAVAMLIMVAVVKLISGMDPEDIVIGIAVMEAFVLLFAQMAVTNRIAGAEVTKFGGTLMKMALAMMLMVGVIKIVSGMDPADIVIGVAVMETFLILIAEMALINRIAGKEVTKFGGTLVAMSVSMLMMAGVVKIISGMDLTDVIKGLAIMQAFALVIAEMLFISRLGKDTKNIAGTILAMSVSIGILAGVAILLSMIDVAGLAKGITAVGLLSLMMTGMVKALKGARNVQGAVMMMAIAIGVMAGAVVALSFIDPSSLAGATIALSMLMGMFGVMIKLSAGAKTSLGTIGIMLGVVVALASILAILSLLNVGSTIEVATSIGILMLSIGATLKIIDNVKSISKSALGALIVLTAIAGVIGIMLAEISKLNPGPTLEIAVALSVVLLAMSGAALILSKIGPIAGAGVQSAAAFLGLVVAAGAILATIGGLIALIPGAEEFLSSGVAIMDSIGRALGSLIGGLIGGIGEGITNSLPQIGQNIADFMSKLADASNNASGIKGDAFSGVGKLVDALIGISIAALIDKFVSFVAGESSMETFKENAIKFVEAMADISRKLGTVKLNEPAIEAIAKCGEMFAELNSSLPRTGGIAQDLAGEQDLIKFGSSCKAFANAMIEINRAVGAPGFETQNDLISDLIEAGKQFNELNTALPRTGGIAQDLAGEQDLIKFGNSCKAFARAMIEINRAVSVDDFKVQNELIGDLVEAGKQFNELNTALPKTGGIAQDLAGEQDLIKFGNSCSAFARAMIGINKTLTAGKISIDTEAFTAMATAGEALNGLQTSLPRTGGWWQDVAGAQDIGDFGTKLEAFGEAMIKLKEGMGDGLPEGTITSIANCGTAMIELQKAIPEEHWLDGKVSLDEFGDKISDFGESLVDYGESVSGIDISAITSSITEAKRLASLANTLVNLDTSGISEFKKVEGIGKVMTSYSDIVKDISASTVTKSVTSAVKLQGLLNDLANTDASGVSNFKIVPIGDAMNTYSYAVSGVNTSKVASTVLAATSLKNFINNLSGIDTSGVGSFKAAIEELGSVSVEKVTNAFNSAKGSLTNVGSNLITAINSGFKSNQTSLNNTISPMMKNLVTTISSNTTAFKTAATSLMTALISGFKTKGTTAKTTLSTIAKEAATKIRSYYSNFYGAGLHLATGFANGITANSYKAVAAARAMATAAKRAAEKALDINSPSKVFYKIGDFTGIGFVKALMDYAPKAYNAGRDIAESARTGLNKAISKITETFNSNLDMQPTIRPVIDLSDVESGASAIDSLLKMGSTLGISANVGAVSSRMNQRNQNGGNDDLISAINDLKNTLSRPSGDTYNINGVTYDDGSNISNAVASIVRAARVERRR